MWVKHPQSQSDSCEVLRHLLQARILLALELPSHFTLFSSVVQVCSIKRCGIFYLESGEGYYVQTMYRKWDKIKHEVTSELKLGHDSFVFRRHYTCHVTNRQLPSLRGRWFHLFPSCFTARTSLFCLPYEDRSSSFIERKNFITEENIISQETYLSNQKCVCPFALPVMAVSLKLWYYSLCFLVK